MAINSNNNAVFTAGTLSIGGGKDMEFFKVTVTDGSSTAVDIDANTHKDGIVDRILQALQTRGTIKYYNVTTTNGVINVGIEGEDTWANTGTGTPINPQTAAAANLQTFLQALGTVSCRASSTSTSDDALIDVSGTDVTASELVLA